VKLVPYGILVVATGALMLVFGSHDTSDAWVDALRMWWLQVGPGLGQGLRTRFLGDLGQYTQ
jgi:hypothetical protein